MLLVPPGTGTYWSAILMYSAFAFRSSGVTITTKRTALSFLNISYDHRRTDRIHFTAAIPLFAINICKKDEFPFLWICNFVSLFCDETGFVVKWVKDPHKRWFFISIIWLSHICSLTNKYYYTCRWKSSKYNVQGQISFEFTFS